LELVEVSEVVARELGAAAALRAQVRAQQADATKAPVTAALTADVWEVDAVSITDHDLVDATAAIDEHSDHPAELFREEGQLGGKFLGEDGALCDSSFVEFFEGLDLAGFELGQITMNLPADGLTP
jgi:hypothetical protein